MKSLMGNGSQAPSCLFSARQVLKCNSARLVPISKGRARNQHQYRLLSNNSHQLK